MKYVQLDDIAALSTGGDDAAVVVPSHRLRDALFEGLAEEARKGRRAVELPRILVVDDLPTDLYQRLVLDGAAPPLRVATPVELRLMVESTLPSELARSSDLFESGWKLVHDHAMSAALARLGTTHGAATDDYDDAKRFRDWALSFEADLARRDRITGPQLPALVARAVARTGRSPLAHLTCVGFEHETPAFGGLLTALASNGCQLRRVALQGRVTTVPMTLRCDDEDDEIRRAVAWARESLQRRATARTQRLLRAPEEVRIGIVVPDLVQRYDAVLRVLYSAFGTIASDAPFNISGGIALDAFPIVDDALAFLRWCVRPERTPIVERLVASPFLHLSFLRDVRTDARLPGAHSLLERAAAADDPRAAELTRQVLRWATRSTHETRVAEFRRVLVAAGWPGTMPLGSEAHQARVAFDALLDEVAVAGDLLTPSEAAAGVESVASATSRRPFAPQRPWVPLQILGYLESVGLRFSALCVTGLARDVWPAAPRPHPLIPRRLQAEHGVARLSVADEIAFARRLVTGWSAAAPNVRLSWPATRDGEPTAMSPLLAAAVPAYPTAVKYATEPIHDVALEPMDTTAAPVDPATIRPLGASAVRDQSLCPFRAFAIHRLNLRSSRELSPFPRAEERGTALHEMMHRLCSEISGSAALVRLVPEERLRIASDAVEAALEASPQRNAPPFYLANERMRLRVLALDWLEVDLARPEFVTESTELDVETSVGSLPMRLRIDRIDRDAATGGLALLDYKSGAANPGQWRGVRPEDPQLPLYAIALRDVEAVAFALVRPAASRLHGVSAAPSRYGQRATPRVKMVEPPEFGVPTWRELMAQWRTIANSLVEALAAGAAAVDPLHASVCRECHLHVLCRIGDRGLGADDDA